MRSVFLFGAMALVTALAACTRPNDAYTAGCIPGEQKACACVGGGTGAQRCRSDGSGFDACLGCDGSPTDLGTDLSAALDMSIMPGADLSSVPHDLAAPRDMAVPRDMAHRDFSSGPPPVDLAGVDFSGIACGAATCASGACCVTPGAPPSQACVAGTTCPTGAYALACDGPEDCGASTCCISGTSSGGTIGSDGASCKPSCPASISSSGGPGGGNTYTTKLCHGAADCAGYTGMTAFGPTAFDRCCTTGALGARYCAPGFVAVVTPQTSCD